MESNRTEDFEVISRGEGRVFGHHSRDKEILARSDTLRIGQDLMDPTWFDDGRGSKYVDGEARVVGYEPMRIGYIAPQINAAIHSCYWCDAPAMIHRPCGCGEPNCVEWVCQDCSHVSL